MRYIKAAEDKDCYQVYYPLYYFNIDGIPEYSGYCTSNDDESKVPYQVSWERLMLCSYIDWVEYV